MYTDNYFNRFELAPEVAEALKKCKCIAYAETKEELQEMAYGPTHTSRYDVVAWQQSPCGRSFRTARSGIRSVRQRHGRSYRCCSGIHP